MLYERKIDPGRLEPNPPPTDGSAREMVRRVPITLLRNDPVVLSIKLDDEDYERLQALPDPRIYEPARAGLPVFCVKVGGRFRSLDRVLLGLGPGYRFEFINEDHLDYRRANLMMVAVNSVLRHEKTWDLLSGQWR